METLVVTVDDAQTPVVISLAGRLDTNTSPQFQDAAFTAIDKGANDLVVDLADCEYVSSAGLRVIVALQKRLMNGTLVFRNLSDEVMDVLEMTGIAKVVTIE